MDKTLRYSELKKLFEHHGCTVRINKKQKIVVTVGERSNARTWIQHAHKGKRDSFDRVVIRAARRKLGFANMDDQTFYAPID